MLSSLHTFCWSTKTPAKSNLTSYTIVKTFLLLPENLQTLLIALGLSNELSKVCAPLPLLQIPLLPLPVHCNRIKLDLTLYSLGHANFKHLGWQVMPYVYHVTWCSFSIGEHYTHK